MGVAIVHKITGAVLCESDAANTLDETMREAVDAGTNLSYEDLSYEDLRYANLNYANLSSANLSSANLRYANLRSANLSSADLRSANLSSANLSSADLRYANLSSANLSSADLRYANLSSADVRYANLSYVDVRSADLSYADVRSANLSSADVRYANLSYVDVRSANLSSADLRYANLRSAEGLNRNLITPLRMLLDQPGKIRAYKLVDAEGYGPFARLTGYTPIRYEIGKSHSVDKWDSDEFKQCGAGISLGTLEWCMKRWRKNYNILIAEFTADDIVAIPIGFDGEFRVQSCKIVAEKSLMEIELIDSEDRKETHDSKD